MTGADPYDAPSAYSEIVQATQQSGFTMPSDIQTCSFLRTLAASKRNAAFLELGTGTGLATSWILDGMDEKSTLISVDNDPACLEIARRWLARDPRLTLVESDGGDWLQSNAQRQFDYIFADTWHGKYLLLEEALRMLKPGGLYIIDDMLPQANWPEGHGITATALLETLARHEALTVTWFEWATGIVVAVKK